MPGRKKKTSCAHCRLRTRRYPSVYCGKHDYLTVDRKGESGAKRRSILQSKEAEVIVESRHVPLVVSIVGCPLLANELTIYNYDPALCEGFRMVEKNLDSGERRHRIIQTVPSGVVRKLKTFLNKVVLVHYKQHGTFRLAGAKYITAVRRTRDPHVSQAVHRDVQIDSPPGYLSIFMFLDDTDNESGGLEIWENSINTVLDSRNTNRDLRKCSQVRIPPKQGTVVVFDGRLAHRGIANTSQNVRVGIHVYAWPDKKGLPCLTVVV
jgi:hypothetical protein